MKKTREKILIALAAIAVAYGVYAFLIKPHGPPGARQRHGPREGAVKLSSGHVGELLEWIARNRQRFTEVTITPFQKLVVQRAMVTWSSDLFLSEPLPHEIMAALEKEQKRHRNRLQAEEAERAAALEAERKRREELEAFVRRFRYSGYVSGETEPSAVVNGVVYKKGEDLADHPYRIVEITPREVVLRATEGDIEISVPFEQ